MAEINQDCADGIFKEAVCIDAGRIYDSCCARDCLEDLRCYFSNDAQGIINQALSVHVRKAEVLKVYIDVEPVSFNRGYYSCDLTFFFVLEFDVFSSPHSLPVQVKGISVFSKKAILFGSDGNVRVFTNDVTAEEDTDSQIKKVTNMPRCVVQCVNPIPLNARLSELPGAQDCVRCIPECVCNYIGGALAIDLPAGTPAVYVTLGLFTIVQLVRNVQMLVPVYDFCIPEKQCDSSTDQPCDVFRRIKFPTGDFFPPRPCDINDESDCVCSDNITI